jgi:hypothetical protein
VFKVGQLVFTELRAAGGWILASKTLQWTPIKEKHPYLLIEIRNAVWAANKVAILLTSEGVLIEVLLDVLKPI